ncbi:Crp/Fnr family transcriptional regulator [Marinomonas sp.]|nr:Crp/Fnr family transcriptional regulator [Marinomonas sp.]MDB4837316.1 Crp/Fnr family transcriptional regulator [Marinomonas sp.]
MDHKQQQNNLKNYFDTLGGAGIEWQHLTLPMESHLICKGDFLFRQGDSANRLYFLHTGLVRYVSVSDEGKEFTQSFIKGPRIIGSTRAMVMDAKVLFGIQALDNCVISSYPWQAFYEQMRQDKCFLECYVHFLESIFISREERTRSFVKHSAERRYLDFCTENRMLKDLIPQQYIASYIGITPEALSRIRKQLQIKRFS